MKRILLSLLFALFLLPLAVMGQCGSNLSVTDADGNSYATLKVGPNCWMQSNLKTRVPGSSIYWADMYPDTNDNLAVYGRLYNWYAAMNIQPGETPVVSEHGFVQGVCPNGWHLPTDAEITQLATYSVSSLHDTHYWLVPGTNTTGFTMLPSGYYNANKNRCEDLRGNSFMWTAQSLDENNPLMVWSDCHCDQFIVDRSAVNNGMSVRCVYKVYQGEVTTDSATNITKNSATLYGTVVFNGYDEEYERGFAYGTDPNNLDQWVVENPAAPEETTPFNKEITGLTVATTYYYQAYIVNDFDTAWGEIKEFSTLKMEVTTDSANHITHYEATLHGNLIHSGYTSVNVGFKYGTSEDALTSVVANADPMTATDQFSCDITGLTANTQYYYKAFAASGTDTVYGVVKDFTTTRSSFTCGTSKVKDVDGNEYNTVQIGNQCWTKENLRTTTKRKNAGNIYTNNTSTGYRADTHGYYYDWAAVMQDESGDKVQGICPTGWHVPSDAEWMQLTYYVCNSTNPDYKCTGCSSSQSPECIAKALASATGWKSNNTNCCAVGNAQASNNATGFSAVPAGDYYGGTYNDFGSIAYFWSATQGSYGGAYRRGLSYDYAYVGRYDANKSEGYSVRCLRDPEALMVTVTFQPNGAMGTMESQSVTSGVATPLNANTFNRDNAPETDRNWAFIGWNTKADGTGVSFANQANVTFDSDTTLYAQWHTWCTGTPKTSVNEFGTSRIDSLKDVDNNKYTVVQIGNQCWMKENLRTANVNDKGTVYTNDADGYNVNIYGRLYDWAAAMQVAGANEKKIDVELPHQGICPTGWHVPSDAELDTLTTYVNKEANGYRCNGYKNIANALSAAMGWDNREIQGCYAGSNSITRNLTGFSAVPAGYYQNSTFSEFGSYAGFWSTTQDDGVKNAEYLELDSHTSGVTLFELFKTDGHSVRCLRDPEALMVTVTFQPNGAMGAMENQTVTSGVAAQLNANAFNRDNAPETDRNWAFIGWNTKADGTGVSFADQANVTFDRDTTLYAQWHTWCTGTPKTSVNEFGTSRIDSLKDVDNNKYTVVQIGNQCWMKQNLRTTKYANGTSIDLGSHTSTTRAYRYYTNGDSSNVGTYGYLYNWIAAVQGICPVGWHVPSDAEFDTLTKYVFSIDDYKCGESCDIWQAQSKVSCIAKALAFTSDWGSEAEASICAVGSNLSANNATGFSAVPAGSYKYGDFGIGAYFWSASQVFGDVYAYFRGLIFNVAHVSWGKHRMSYGFSVRCVRDAEAPVQTVTVTFQPNGAMGTMENQTVTSGVATQLNANTFNRDNAPETDKNWAFIGWNTKADGTGVSFANQANVTFDSDTTLYAQWHTWCTGTPKTSVNEFGTSRIDSLKDVDNNKYTVVQIGNQCWMKENLRTTKYADGISISFGGTTTSFNTAYRYFPKNDTTNVSTYGHLYNWTAVTKGASSSEANPSGVQGICPDGWHVPSDLEWTQLTDYVKGKTEYQCGGSADNIANALSTTTGWNSSISSGCNAGNSGDKSNATGFAAVPAGYSYDNFGSHAYFWSATQDGSFDDGAYYRDLYYDDPYVGRNGNFKNVGISVRCLRDPEALMVTVTFQPNGAMGTMESQSVTSGVATQLNANTFNRDNAPEKDRNWAFIGWNTKADGTGVSFANQANVTFDSDTTLYAQWHTWCNGTPKTSVNEFGTSRIDSLKDVDNNKYTVVQIGNQCWIKQNLRTTAGLTVNTDFWHANGSAVNDETYGLLYNWAAATKGASTNYPASGSKVQGICPAGWHVPSDAEWDTLTYYVYNSTNSDYKCTGCSSSGWTQSTECIAKALASATGWKSNNTITCDPGNDQAPNNATGFSAVPAGGYYGPYDNFGIGARFWSATQETSYLAYYRLLNYNSTLVDKGDYSKNGGFSVRCLRDPE